MCAAYYIRGNGKSKIFAMSGVVNAISLSIFNVIFLVILKTGKNGYLLSIGLSYCVSAIYLIAAGKIAKVFLPIIMLAAILNCVSSLLGTMYSTYKKTQKMIGVSLVGSATNIIVGLVLTPILGIWGVCIASVFCYLSQVIYKFVDVRKFCKIKYNWIKIMPNLLLLTLQVILMSTDKTSLFGLAILVALVLFVINSGDVVKAVKKVVRR